MRRKFETESPKMKFEKENINFRAHYNL